MAKKIATLETHAPESTTTDREPAVVTLSWAADTPARQNPDSTQPTLDELEEGQIAVECGLSRTSGELEDIESLCRTLASHLDTDTPAHLLRDALSVIGERIKDIRFRLDEHSDAIVPLHNLAAWYFRSVSAQGGAR